jgi:hypothetical protein
MIDKFAKKSAQSSKMVMEKDDMQGVVFLAGSRLYMRYVEGLPKIYSEGGRPFFDTINDCLAAIRSLS